MADGALGVPVLLRTALRFAAMAHRHVGVRIRRLMSVALLVRDQVRRPVLLPQGAARRIVPIVVVTTAAAALAQAPSEVSLAVAAIPMVLRWCLLTIPKWMTLAA